MNKRLEKYYGCIVIGLAVFMVCALSRELFAGLPLKDTFAVLSDCFFIPGIILAGIGGLSWISSTGGYDILGYAASTLRSHFSRKMDKPESYYDYKQRRAEDRKKWLREALFTGFGFIALAAISTVVYYLV